LYFYKHIKKINMNFILRLVSFAIFFGLAQFSFAQINIKVSVKSISVSSNLNCDVGLGNNSDFVFEYKALDNSPLLNGNNNPVSGSIGACNYAVVSEQNGSYTLTPLSPGSAVFSPTTGLFFDRTYNCKSEIPTLLTITWRAYENDDAINPSVTPIANGVVPADAVSYNVPTTNGTYTTQYTQTSTDGTCPQTYVIEFEIEKTNGAFLPLTLGVPEANVICTGASNGFVEVDATGGSGTVLYDWSIDGVGDFDDNVMETGLTAGTYTLVVKDALNCTDTAIVSVFASNPPVNISLYTASTASVCTGATGIVYAVPTQTDVTFYWSFSGPGGVINNTANSITMDFLSFSDSGVLSVYAENACSASPTLTMDITVQQSPSISIAGSNNMCANAQEVLTASGATTYSWNTGSTTANETVSPSTLTVYTVTGTGPGGCMSSTEFTMNVMPTPTLQVNVSTVAVCPNQTIVATAAGNGSLFFWSDGFIGANHNVKALTTTIFTVTNTFTNSCYSQVTFTLNVKPGPALTVVGNTIVCEGGTISLTAGGADTYTWSNGPTTHTNEFIPSMSNTLTVVGTATNGCVDSLAQAIKVVSTLTVTISGNDTICEGQSTTLTASTNGNVIYAWNSGANTSTISVTPTGTFTYVVIANNGGCTDTAAHEVFVKLIPTVDFTVNNSLLCVGDAMITFTASPLGGIFSGTGVTMINMFDPSIGVGSYPVTYEVPTNNGCTAAATQTIDVMFCTGINSATATSDLKLFPNPTVADITILSDKEISSVLVYDFTGKLVRILEAHTFETKVDLSALAKGFYTFNVLMIDKTQKVLKVMKE
jgi:hypothetical protein